MRSPASARKPRYRVLAVLAVSVAVAAILRPSAYGWPLHPASSNGGAVLSVPIPHGPYCLGVEWKGQPGFWAQGTSEGDGC